MGLPYIGKSLSGALFSLRESRPFRAGEGFSFFIRCALPGPERPTLPQAGGLHALADGALLLTSKIGKLFLIGS